MSGHEVEAGDRSQHSDDFRQMELMSSEVKNSGRRSSAVLWMPAGESREVK